MKAVSAHALQAKANVAMVAFKDHADDSVTDEFVDFMKSFTADVRDFLEAQREEGNQPRTADETVAASTPAQKPRLRAVK